MITGDRLQIGHDPTRHAAFVGSWIQTLKDDPREIYRASKDAQDMSDYLLDRGREHRHGREGRAETRVPGDAATVSGEAAVAGSIRGTGSGCRS